MVLLTNAPAPYRTPVFNELSKRCRLLVLFDIRRESNREWAVDEQDFDFRWSYTRSLSIARRRDRHEYGERGVVHIPLNVVSVLKRFDPDVVISSELGARTASAAVFCRLRKRPLIIWWEGTLHTEGGRSALRTAFRRKLLKRATRAWGNGEESAESLAAYGVPASRIDLGMAGMDTARFQKDLEERGSPMRSALRTQHGLRGYVLLFVGSLVPRKGVRELLAALSLLAQDRDLPAWSVLIVGSGPLAHEVEEWAHLHPEVTIALVGFVQPSEMAKYYAVADLFVMPTLSDCWAFVVLEALVAGIPQLTSPFAAAAADLVTSSEIGTVIDPRDKRSLAEQLARRIRAGSQRVPEALRTHAMATWSAEAFAERAMSSIRSARHGRDAARDVDVDVI